MRRGSNAMRVLTWAGVIVTAGVVLIAMVAFVIETF